MAHDGVITRDELCMAYLQEPTLFDAMDCDKSGTVTLEEWHNFLKKSMWVKGNRWLLELLDTLCKNLDETEAEAAMDGDYAAMKIQATIHGKKARAGTKAKLHAAQDENTNTLGALRSQVNIRVQSVIETHGDTGSTSGNIDESKSDSHAKAVAENAEKMKQLAEQQAQDMKQHELDLRTAAEQHAQDMKKQHELDLRTAAAANEEAMARLADEHKENVEVMTRLAEEHQQDLLDTKQQMKPKTIAIVEIVLDGAGAKISMARAAVAFAEAHVQRCQEECCQSQAQVENEMIAMEKIQNKLEQSKVDGADLDETRAGANQIMTSSKSVLVEKEKLEKVKVKVAELAEQILIQTTLCLNLVSAPELTKGPEYEQSLMAARLSLAEMFVMFHKTDVTATEAEILICRLDSERQRTVVAQEWKIATQKEERVQKLYSQAVAAIATQEILQVEAKQKLLEAKQATVTATEATVDIMKQGKSLSTDQEVKYIELSGKIAHCAKSVAVAEAQIINDVLLEVKKQHEATASVEKHFTQDEKEAAKLEMESQRFAIDATTIWKTTMTQMVEAEASRVSMTTKFVELVCNLGCIDVLDVALDQGVDVAIELVTAQTDLSDAIMKAADAVKAVCQDAKTAWDLLYPAEKPRKRQPTVLDLSQMSPEKRDTALAAMSPEEQATAMATMSPDEQVTTLAAMSRKEQVTALAAMLPEERAAILAVMSPEERPAILAAMSTEERAAVLVAMSPEERAAAMATMSLEARAVVMATISKERAVSIATMSPEEKATAMAAMSPEEAVAALAAMSPEERSAAMATMPLGERCGVLAAMLTDEKIIAMNGMSAQDRDATLAAMSSEERTTTQAAITAASMLTMTPEVRHASLAAMSAEERALVICAMPPLDQSQMLAAMPPEDRAAILRAMPPKELAVALMAMSPENRDATLAMMSPEEREAAEAAAMASMPRGQVMALRMMQRNRKRVEKGHHQTMLRSWRASMTNDNLEKGKTTLAPLSKAEKMAYHNLDRIMNQIVLDVRKDIIRHWRISQKLGDKMVKGAVEDVLLNHCQELYDSRNKDEETQEREIHLTARLYGVKLYSKMSAMRHLRLALMRLDGTKLRQIVHLWHHHIPPEERYYNVEPVESLRETLRVTSEQRAIILIENSRLKEEMLTKPCNSCVIMTEERNAAMHSAQVAMMELARVESQEKKLETTKKTNSMKEAALRKKDQDARDKAMEVDTIMKTLLAKTMEERDDALTKLNTATDKVNALNYELSELKTGDTAKQLEETREALTRVAQDSAQAFIKMSNEMDKNKLELSETKDELARFRDLSSALAEKEPSVEILPPRATDTPVKLLPPDEHSSVWYLEGTAAAVREGSPTVSPSMWSDPQGNASDLIDRVSHMERLAEEAITNLATEVSTSRNRYDGPNPKLERARRRSRDMRVNSPRDESPGEDPPPWKGYTSPQDTFSAEQMLRYDLAQRDLTKTSYGGGRTIANIPIGRYM